ncbi:MAG: alpha-L-fucosidase [Planctomycetota bacterium]|nr:alpha-L-fucosidase [Planctomycetota bacterium]
MKSLLLLLCVVPATVLARDPEPAKTDWFMASKYGVFVHYLVGLQNNPDHVASLGRQTSWDECVREFDVEKFADRMRDAGAGYVIFTMIQRSRFLIAPNATFDRLTGYRPGEACATRDLVEDLYQALNKRGIALMLYWTGDGPCDDPQAAQALRWPATGQVTDEFVRNWSEVVREYGLRYRDKVKGWWTDGCYRFIGYDEQKLGVLAEALRAGYRQRIVSLNPGVEDRVRPYSRHEDFTTGEQNSFTDFPVSRFVDGEQWHVLSYLGSGWAQPGTAKTKAEMVDYVNACNSLGGVVSIDVVLYRDGDLDRSQLEVLKAIRPGLAKKSNELDAWRDGQAVPPRNKAWRKPAFLMNADGKYRLGPSVGDVHAARCGVDGNTATSAVAGNEWAWAYDVNLLRTEKLSRVVIAFGPGFATEFEVLATIDGTKWQKLASLRDQKGGRVEVRFDPVEVRIVRVRAIKPDGPSQPGTQMSIAELEAYE